MSRMLAAPPLAAAAAWCAPAVAAVVPGLAGALRIPTRCASSETAALTFDDGPDPRGTPAVLEALAAAGARATFFLVGEQVRRDPALAAEIVAAGHAVAVHGDRHRSLLRLGARAAREDFDRAGDAIAGATGRRPVLHRAPYGVYAWPALAELRRRGWRPVLWSAWGRDWRADATPRSVAARVLRDAGPGGVVLLHDADRYGDPGCWRATAAALPEILGGLEGRGLRLVTLEDPASVQAAPGR